MPPVVFVGAAAAPTVAASSLSFIVPATTRTRDTLLAFVSDLSTNGGPDLDELEADGWDQITAFVGAASTIWALRRERALGDASVVEIPFLDPLTNGIGALVAYRNLNNGAAAVASSSSNIAASVNFVCPSAVLTRYSDVYLGIVLVTSAAVAVTPPGTGTERVEIQLGGRTLEIFDRLLEVTGGTGTHTATTAGAQTGIAAALALAADALVGQGKTFTVEPIGAPGLPRYGV